MQGFINLQSMRPLSDALVQDDDWTGLTDARARRRRQNRLNQRAHRRRKEQGIIFPTNVLSRLTTENTTISTPSLYSGPLYFPLTVDHLLTLVQFNVFRALLTNMAILSLPGIFSCEPPTSNLAAISTGMALEDTVMPDELPPALVPTALQRSVQHEPWAALFPLPALRDNLIRFRGTYDECEMCDDVLGTMYDDQVSSHDERNGILVWGDPWNVYSWELMDGFVKKWGYILTGCEELIDASNRWRAIRGEGPLSLGVEIRHR